MGRAMTHQILKRYQLVGKTTGKDLEKHKATFTLTLTNMMRDEGFTPYLDIDPTWSWSWIEEDKYEFVYTWHAVYVGEEEAWRIAGVSGGKKIPSTPRTK